MAPEPARGGAADVHGGERKARAVPHVHPEHKTQGPWTKVKWELEPEVDCPSTAAFGLGELTQAGIGRFHSGPTKHSTLETTHSEGMEWL